MTESRTIHQRLADAYVDISAATFSKSGTVNPGTKNSYGFIPIGQMLNIVRQAHAKNGILTLFGQPKYDPTQHETRKEVKKVSKYDGAESTWYFANGHIDVQIIGADGDVIETTVSCEASDNSDKLNNKLLTNAERTLYRTLYAIDEGSPDPESENIEIGTIKTVEEQPVKKIRTPPADDPFFSRKESKSEEPKKKNNIDEGDRYSEERRKLLYNDIIDEMLGSEQMEECVLSQVKFYGKKKLEDCDCRTLESIRDQLRSLRGGQ